MFYSRTAEQGSCIVLSVIFYFIKRERKRTVQTTHLHTAKSRYRRNCIINEKNNRTLLEKQKTKPSKLHLATYTRLNPNANRWKY
jgi:hypothetical protein